ncbi:MAG: signal peptidase I [Clostridiales bacterium]|nr:signal peptidase I [Clostridiales bacterium]
MQDLLLNQKQEKSDDFGFTAVLIVFLILIYFIFTNVYSLVVVNGSSMEGTLLEGDVLFVNHVENYERGDVIVFNYDEKMLIKRVIAVEGDEIKCKNGVLMIKFNGEDVFKVIDEPYAVKGTKDIEPTLINEGELYVLGDNRPISNDSSSFGPIKKDSILGVVTNFSIENKEILTKIFGWAFKKSGLED